MMYDVSIGSVLTLFKDKSWTEVGLIDVAFNVDIYSRRPHSETDYTKQIEFLQQQDYEQRRLLFLWDDVELEGNLILSMSLHFVEPTRASSDDSSSDEDSDSKTFNENASVKSATSSPSTHTPSSKTSSRSSSRSVSLRSKDSDNVQRSSDSGSPNSHTPRRRDSESGSA
jgi:hypothetical protein